MKSALRDWLSASYSMISIMRIGSLHSPPLSGCTGLLHGKASHEIFGRLRLPTNFFRLPPLFRGQNKPLYPFLQSHVAHLSSIHSPTALAGGRWWRQPPKGDTPEWYMKYMPPCFSLHISRFPLRGNAT